MSPLAVVSEVVEDFVAWLRGLDDSSYCGIPLEWQ